MTKMFAGSLAALAMTAAPIAATPAFAAPTTNPAASLSVAKSVRASTPSAKKNDLAGGGLIFAALIAAGVIAIVAVAASKDDSADSN
ncbi:hypothetical protein M9979_12515 [Sphingomonas sp. RP10(2022)]|uniref:Transmembrane protein n=1 Tax=Sphingomonas liriopis TaxID=2949094 RepID=A0A9X2HTP5_9SPHN|nr:hypothetical protein [Sphingomonas liriopis]MCP3735697.1 hypothetical protein [Sphingomonas liriopis]